MSNTNNDSPSKMYEAMLTERYAHHPFASDIRFKHDVTLARWCDALSTTAYQNAYVQSLSIAFEVPIAQQQRIDAIVSLRVSKKPRLRSKTLPFLRPYENAWPCSFDEQEIRIALEYDQDVTPPSVLQRQAESYRDLTASGVYTRTFGSIVLPVLLVPTEKRAQQLTNVWRHVWPNGWGRIAVLDEASHPTYGVLWGNYRCMMTDDAPSSLMTTATCDEHNRITSSLILNRSQWCGGMAREMRATRQSSAAE